MSLPRIIFRADGNESIGLGHVYRSLALAEMLYDRFDCHFVIQNPLPKLKEVILKFCKTIIELPQTSDWDNECQLLTSDFIKPTDFIILDGYHFNTKYQRHLKEASSILISIDDIYSDHFVSDAVINHAGGIDPKSYSKEPYTQLLLGPQYALLRSEFIKFSQERSYPQRNQKNVFISLGGADPHNDLLKVLYQCDKNRSIESCSIVIGMAYSYMAELKEYLANTSLDIRLFSNLDAAEMVECMKSCGIAITSPSSVSYEYLSIGGILFLKTIADNQTSISDYLISSELALEFNDSFSEIECSTNLSTQFIARQKEVFDGKQKRRLLEILLYYTIDARRTKANDCLTYFEWANDPATRQQSYQREIITLKNHKTWFKSKHDSPNTAMFVITQNENTIGQVRFDLMEGSATISYSLDKQYRGQGYGTLILKKGIATFKNAYPEINNIIGFVKKDNRASVSAFKSLNFKEEIAKKIKNSFKFSST